MNQEMKQEIFPPEVTDYEIRSGELHILAEEEGRSRFDAGDRTDGET